METRRTNPTRAGTYTQTDGEFTVTSYAYWDHRSFPPRLVHSDFDALKQKWRQEYPVSPDETAP